MARGQPLHEIRVLRRDPATGVPGDELHLLGPGYTLWRDQIEIAVRRGGGEPEPEAEPELEEPALEGPSDDAAGGEAT